MKNQKADYLAARLGIVSNTNNVPYGWEIPEDETTSEPRASTNLRSSLGLLTVALLAVFSVLKVIQNKSYLG
jgi:hypothetical protein